MLNEFVALTYSQARYIVLKEVDTHGPIGTILTNDNHQLTAILMGVADDIDRMMVEQKEEISLSVPRDYFDAFIRIAEKLPYFILNYSHYNWNTFISAYLCFLTKYTSLKRSLIEEFVTPEEIEHHKGTLMRLKDIETSLTSVTQLLELGMSYTDLIKASSEVIKELQMWRESNPSAVRLSEAYLTTLGLLKGD